MTTDFRSVFSEVAGKHLGVTDDATIFPGWGGERVRARPVILSASGL